MLSLVAENPADKYFQPWMRWLLVPGGFTVNPEINAVIERGEMIETARAKEIAREFITYLKGYMPKVVAIRDAIHAIEEIDDAVEKAVKTLARADDVLSIDPDNDTFLTPAQELAARAGRLARRAIVERNIVNRHDFDFIADEMFESARAEMRARGKPVPEGSSQDLIPVSMLRLRQDVEGLRPIVQAILEGPPLVLKWHLDLGLVPHQSGGRPSMNFAMFIAWLLQDTGPRPMPDHRVVAFLEDACADLPPDAPQIVPSVKSVAEWRRDRAKLPRLPRYDRSLKPK